MRRGGRARAEDRARCSSWRLEPDLRPEPDREARTSSRRPAASSAAAPLLNRADAGPLHRRARRFKVLTASAALDSGKFTPDSTFNDPGYCDEYGQKVSNFADQSGPEVVRPCQLHAGAPALDQLRLLQHREEDRREGAPRLREEFGFYSVPPLETPVNERAISGLYDKRKLSTRRTDDAGRPWPARLRPGADCSVTPLQMAMVAATVANGGVAHAAVRRRPHRRAGRDDRRHDEAGCARPRDHAEARPRTHVDDGGGRHRAAPAPRRRSRASRSRARPEPPRPARTT